MPRDEDETDVLRRVVAAIRQIRGDVERRRIVVNVSDGVVDRWESARVAVPVEIDGRPLVGRFERIDAPYFLTALGDSFPVLENHGFDPVAAATFDREVFDNARFPFPVDGRDSRSCRRLDQPGIEMNRPDEDGDVFRRPSPVVESGFDA
ncbi:hypothetical protein [Haladaptatus sp. R4]|uniref:hypothetical protein n=1 Tax=Haladaptatus sp. R4 TaxID=1679489 RepID=UPI0009EF0FD6